MKKIISTILCFCIAFSLLTTASLAISFSDVRSGVWYSEGVSYCATKGYVSGYSDGTFRPNRNLTRAEMAVIMSNMMNLTDSSGVSFSDVPSGQWYTEAVRKCAKANLINGYGNGKFGPSDQVTREQAAVILGNAFGLGKESEYPNFSDANKISDWSYKSVNSMVSHGYMAGMENRKFEPQGKLTRGQIVTIIYAHDKDVSSRSSLDSSGWKEAYIDYINAGFNNRLWDSDTSFRLVDVDGDGIPELHRVAVTIAQGNSLVGYYHGRLERMDCYAIGIKIDEGKGKFCNCELEGDRDRIAYRYYSLNDGKFTLLHTGYWFSEKAGREEYCTWDGVRVSTSKFQSLQNSVFVFKDVSASEFVYKDEIIRQIREYKSTKPSQVTPSPSPTQVVAEEGFVDSSEAYSLLNAFRTESGVWYWNEDNSTKTVFNTGANPKLVALKRSSALEETAKIRAKELASSFSHTRPNGSNCFTAYPQSMRSMGENIAYGYSSCKAVTEAWKETNENYSGQGHRRNMLNSSFNAVGIAGYIHNGTIYWVQAFGYEN